MRASIIIPTCRRYDLLLRGLASACQQDFPADQYEVIVADDAGCDKTRFFVESLGHSTACQLHYVAVEPVHGPAAALNCGWREARGDILAFTDDDCIPDPTWLSAGVKLLEEQPELAAASGKLEMPLPEWPTDYQRDAAGLAKAGFVTANCFVRRDAMLVVGGFDQRFRVAWREDSDLYYSLLEHGFAVGQATNALVVHPIRPAPWGVSLSQQAKSRFDVLLYRKHPCLYKQHIPGFPKLYVAVVSAGMAGVLLLPLKLWQLSLGLLLVSLLFSLWFAWSRLQGTSRKPSHIAEMLLTSLAIPWLATYHRLAGWWKYA